MRSSFLLMILLCLTTIQAGAENNLDEMLKRLDSTIERRDVYYMRHQYVIDSIKSMLHTPEVSSNKLRQYAVYSSLFDKYRSYQSDSAKVYAQKQYDIAQALNKDSLKVDANYDMIFYYLSAGIFKDACDYANQTDLSNVSDSQKSAYYYLCIRLYSDMSNFSSKTFDDKYARLSHAYSDSVIALAPAGSYHSLYASIFKSSDTLSVDQKITTYKEIMSMPNIDAGTKAMISSIIADQYISKGETDNAIYYKALSATLDIESAKRETTATRDLAFFMYQRGELDRASKYINAALEDANSFNARHRKMEINKILPLIEIARYHTLNTQKNILWWVVAVISLFAILLVGAVFYIIRQVRKLRAARRIIEERNEVIERRNKEIEEHNIQLQDTNNRLRESNKIKDEYIGYGFYVNSEYIRKMEALHKLVNRKIAAKQYDDLRMSLKESDLRKEKENMHQEFDRIFLKLFPTFIRQFNALFAPEDAACPDDAKMLTSEMRIFALIRLGINDNSNIASFLNYSVNTVNTYKTKTKNRSIIPNDQFEQKIMEIRSIS